MHVLQELNPIPFPVVVANCVAWVGYSIVTKDPYVFMANDPGLVLGLFYTFSAYGFADSKVGSLTCGHNSRKKPETTCNRIVGLCSPFFGSKLSDAADEE